MSPPETKPELLTPAGGLPTELWKRLSGIADANGNAQGVEAGSFAIRNEMERQRMKRPSAR